MEESSSRPPQQQSCKKGNSTAPDITPASSGRRRPSVLLAELVDRSYSWTGNSADGSECNFWPQGSQTPRKRGHRRSSIEVQQGLQAARSNLWEQALSHQQNKGTERASKKPSWSTRLSYLGNRCRSLAELTGKVIIRSPWGMAFNVLLLLFLVGLGTWGVLSFVSAAESQARNTAVDLAKDVSRHYEATLERLWVPAITLTTFIKTIGPQWPAVQASFLAIATHIMANYKNDEIVQIELSPNAIVSVYKVADPADEDPGTLGLNLLADTRYRDGALRTIESGKLTTVGPIPGQRLSNRYFLIVRMPIFIANVSSPDVSFGGPGGRPYDCPVCYRNSSQEMFWGFSTTLLDWELLSNIIEQLGERGYSYCVGAPSDTLLPGQGAGCTAGKHFANAASGYAAVPDLDMMAQAPLSSPECVEVHMPNSDWRLCLELSGGWTPGWYIPLLVVVVVAACVISGLVFGILVSQKQHQWLLETVLPRAAIAAIKDRRPFVQSFENVTILFSDIESWTTMASILSPLEVVQLLNEVYSLYDDLAAQHGVFKVETIGDAFMCCGGVPNEEHPALAAVRVAHMAQAMVQVTQNFVSSRGYRIRIRVGIHSGPVVAAIIGTKMPHYALFGDSVNVASRMESTSKAMKVQISSSTAKLLMSAGAVQLQEILSSGPPPASQAQEMTSFGLMSISQLQDVLSSGGALVSQQQDMALVSACSPRSSGAMASASVAAAVAAAAAAVAADPAAVPPAAAAGGPGDAATAATAGGGGDAAAAAAAAAAIPAAADVSEGLRAAQLLLQSGPPLRITPRGNIMVKGKGEMFTYFLAVPGTPTTQEPDTGSVASSMPDAGCSPHMLPSPAALCPTAPCTPQITSTNPAPASGPDPASTSAVAAVGAAIARAENSMHMHQPSSVSPQGLSHVHNPPEPELGLATGTAVVPLHERSAPASEAPSSGASSVIPSPPNSGSTSPLAASSMTGPSLGYGQRPPVQRGASRLRRNTSLTSSTSAATGSATTYHPPTPHHNANTLADCPSPDQCASSAADLASNSYHRSDQGEISEGEISPVQPPLKQQLSGSSRKQAYSSSSPQLGMGQQQQQQAPTQRQHPASMLEHSLLQAADLHARLRHQQQHFLHDREDVEEGLGQRPGKQSQ